MRVYVLLFNPGTDNEGIHSLTIGDRNILLMFEQEDDAARYAMLLEAQDFPVPAVEAIDREEIEEFCREAGFEAQFIARDFVPQNEFERLLLAPPELNQDELDWDPEERREPPRAIAEDTSPEPEAGEFSSDELDSIRRRLEGLL